MRSLGPDELLSLQSADRIEILGIRAEGVHGVYPEEALAPQPFEVDVTMWLNMDDAVEFDDLTATIDYVATSKLVRNVIETSPVLLVESLAAAVCEELLEKTAALAVSACVQKPRAASDAGASDVRLTMTRTR